MVIPKDITTIGGYTFFGCSEIKNVTIPKGVTGIWSYAFASCRDLIDVTISDGVIDIGSYAFADCSNLIDITIPDSVIDIGSYAFAGCSHLIDITIPDSVINIGESAFENCDVLNYSEYGNAYYLGTDENPYAFLIKAKSEGVRSCEVHKDTKVICSKSFVNSSIRTVTIGEKVTTIADSAFYGCRYLTSIVIPKTLTSIGDSAFYGCDRLKDIYITDFTSWCNVSGLSNLMVDYYYYGSRNLYLNEQPITNLVIPEEVTHIADYAFYGCKELTSVVIPNNITHIGKSAFEKCDLLNYNKYDNALYLGNNGNPYLVLVKAKDTLISACNINPQTKIILDRAFADCDKLVSVIIPDSVNIIGEKAFRNKDIYYCGDKAEWDVLGITEGVNNVYYYSKSKPADCDGTQWHYVEDQPVRWIDGGILELYYSKTMLNSSYFREEFSDDVIDSKSIYSDIVSTYTFEVLCNYDQVILNNITNYDLHNSKLPKDFDLMLQKYVSEFGGCLLTVGGDNNTYSQSDMGNSVYEDMLPIKTNSENGCGIAVVMLIDRSGSMSTTTAAGHNAYWHAIQGAGECLNALTAKDYFGIVTFDDSYQRVLDLTPMTQKSLIYDTLQNKMPELGGGTVFTGAIRDAVQMLIANKKVRRRHIIMVTDAQINASEVEACTQILETYYKSDKVTLSAIGIGSEASSAGGVASLQKLIDAAGGQQSGIPGGRKVRTYDSSNLTKLYGDMRDELSYSQLKDDLTILHIKNKTYLTKGISLEEFDRLRVYSFFVEAKSNDYVHLTGDSGQPLYADRVYGNGKVGCFLFVVNYNAQSYKQLIVNSIQYLRKADK